MKFLKIKNSKNLYNKAIKLIPSASQTFSKSSKVFDKNFFPLFSSKGINQYIIDLDNNKFLDLPILNKHFIIDPGQAALTATSQEEALLAIDQEDESNYKTVLLPAVESANKGTKGIKSAVILDDKVVNNKYNIVTVSLI